MNHNYGVSANFYISIQSDMKIFLVFQMYRYYLHHFELHMSKTINLSTFLFSQNQNALSDNLPS